MNRYPVIVCGKREWGKRFVLKVRRTRKTDKSLRLIKLRIKIGNRCRGASAHVALHKCNFQNNGVLHKPIKF